MANGGLFPDYEPRPIVIQRLLASAYFYAHTQITAKSLLVISHRVLVVHLISDLVTWLFVSILLSEVVCCMYIEQKVAVAYGLWSYRHPS